MEYFGFFLFARWIHSIWIHLGLTLRTNEMMHQMLKKMKRIYVWMMTYLWSLMCLQNRTNGICIHKIQ